MGMWRSGARGELRKAGGAAGKGRPAGCFGRFAPGVHSAMRGA
jgi:hypothetical protein